MRACPKLTSKLAASWLSSLAGFVKHEAVVCYALRPQHADSTAELIEPFDVSEYVPTPQGQVHQRTRRNLIIAEDHAWGLVRRQSSSPDGAGLVDFKQAKSLFAEAGAAQSRIESASLEAPLD